MARTIRYARDSTALFHPERDSSVLTPNAQVASDALYAEMSRLAYRRFALPGPDRTYVEAHVGHVGYVETQFFTAQGSECFAALHPGSRTAVVSFRGTQSDDFRDVMTDARFIPMTWAWGGNVHSGFCGAALALLDCGLRAWIRQHSDWKRTHTGHSLGAALATLVASAEPASDLVTFGSPRVGDEAFGLSLGAVAIRRYVDCCDLVTRLPSASPWYAHVGAPRYIDRNGIVGNGTDAEEVRRDQDHARLEYFHDHALAPGDVPVRDLADHAAANYVYALFATPA